jgi:hypothetical protein
VALLSLAATARSTGALLVLAAEGDVGPSAVREKAADIGCEGRREISHKGTISPSTAASDFSAFTVHIELYVFYGHGPPRHSSGRGLAFFHDDVPVTNEP